MSPSTTFCIKVPNRNVARYFEKLGQKVPWQKLAAEFDDETFRVQVLDEGDYPDLDWRADLKKLLESAVY